MYAVGTGALASGIEKCWLSGLQQLRTLNEQAMNQDQPEKIAALKWTSIRPVNREKKHFIVIEVPGR